MKKNFFFLSSYPHSAPGNRLNVFCQFRMLQSVGSPPPLGEGARDGCGRQPLRSGRAGGESPLIRPDLQGLPPAPIPVRPPPRGRAPNRLGQSNISIFRAGNLGHAAQEPLHSKLKEDI